MMRLIGVCTVSGETPTVVPAVARICVEPMANAVTAPVDGSTEAMEGDVDDHANVGCVAMALPRPSTATAEYEKVPVTYNARDPGVTFTLATRCCTMTSAESRVP